MLKLKNVSFAYDAKPILKNISFEVEQGAHVSVIGESGCGKSTLLQLIYGLHHTDGRIFWKEQELLGPNFNLVPGEPFFKYLAQDFDLMLPLSVADNVGKYLSNMYPRKKKQRIAELLEVVEMQDLSQVKAKHLSGGQQQRVALARALAKEPELLLLDEPFSHIDHFRKNNLRRKVFRYLKDKNITCITATHDSTDALSFADKTIVLKDGKIHSQAQPEQLYMNPPNKYVASLFGDVNEIKIKDLNPSEKSRKKILLYPHELEVTEEGSAEAVVIQSFFKGKNFEIQAEIKNQTIFFENQTSLDPGKLVKLYVSPELISRRTDTGC
ncbi:ABC transporter ATP-binding protein [Antarcticibacterium sp. 1MA-6-2]|uniref:ABC transporter ATP-binding protein n=1 Tax=Antarcticibacterium sp. 1MA-6-2 TaxID=2908210 RepID=UPI001F24D67F|nr:ABC transporter ATP-binding protein [Antarcticibacterium sp. 1MA-6-2]UJH90054.1 ABC transporter ATP-binding protein [Antarcticibacterium sp. 1MA-6-2]